MMSTPAKTLTRERWGPLEDATLRRMMRSGKSAATIARAMPDRSERAVRERIKYLRRKMRNRKRRQSRPPYFNEMSSVTGPRMSEEAIAALYRGQFY